MQLDFSVVNVWVILLTLFVCVFSAALWIVMMQRQRIVSGRYRAVEGRVTRINGFSGSGNGPSRKDRVEVAYEIDGARCTVTDPPAICIGGFSEKTLGSKTYSVGDRVDLTVDTCSPQKVWLKSSNRFLYVIMAVSAVLSIISLVILLIQQ